MISLNLLSLSHFFHYFILYIIFSNGKQNFKLGCITIHTFRLVQIQTQLSGTRVVISIFLIECTFIS